MKMLLFDGTPEEFARVEALFTAGALRGAPAAPAPRPRDWPALDDAQRHALAKLALGRSPARVRAAVVALAELERSHGPQPLAAWARHAGRQPEEVCGYLAELSRGVARAFAELFGYPSLPARPQGGAYLLLERVGPGGARRPVTRRALAELGL